MQSYTITIIPPESAKAPMWSAHCAENGFTTENKTPEEALSSLFDAINIVNKMNNTQTKYVKPRFAKDFSKKEFKFQIPAFA